MTSFDQKKTGFKAVLGTAALMVGMFSSAAAHAEPKELRGDVIYRERIALPPDASVQVKLVDVSRADAPATVISEIQIKPAGQVPIAYTLSYDSDDILPGHDYALQARIERGDQLLFINTARHPAFASSNGTQNIHVESVVRQVGDPSGQWLAEAIAGGGVLDRVQTVLTIGSDGSVSGTGGCNRIAGKATFSGAKITFGPLASTEMLCSPAVMEQEKRFFAALTQTASWSVDPVRKKLTLSDAAGTVVLVLAQQSAP